jgi:hypothetical protein
MASSDRQHITKVASRLKPIAPKLEPLLDEDKFTLYDAGITTMAEFQDIKGVVMKAHQQGALIQMDRVEPDDRPDDCSNTGDVYQYRWAEGAREDLREYLDGLDTMPECDCRLHIPDGRDAPEGQLRCNHCGQLTDKDALRECLE